jgi:hypothetical protein
VGAKGRKRGRCPGFIRAKRGGRGSGRGQAGGGLAIDGRRRCGIKKGKEETEGFGGETDAGDYGS